MCLHITTLSIKALQCAYNVLAMKVSLKAYNVSACMSPKCLLKDYIVHTMTACLLPKCLVCSQTYHHHACEQSVA